MDLMEKIYSKSKKLGKRICLPEPSDDRVLYAAAKIAKDGIAYPVLLGKEDDIRARAKEISVNLKGVEIIEPAKTSSLQGYIETLYERRKHKGMTLDEAREILLSDPLYYAVMMVYSGDVDGEVAGSASPTANVLRPALQVIKTKPGISLVSGAFIMISKDDRVMVFADCAVNPDPDPEQLAEIAISSARTAKSVAMIAQPRVAMLSFSTKGSGVHPLVDKVKEATKLAKEFSKGEFDIDGEMQADTALVDSVAKKKAPGSSVAGRANCLIFPDLNAGNIGYKLVQRLAGMKAVGPILQGLAKPVNDLSRGCSVDDIYDLVAITSLLGEE